MKGWFETREVAPRVYAMRYGAHFPWLEGQDVATHACPLAHCSQPAPPVLARPVPNPTGSRDDRPGVLARPGDWADYKNPVVFELRRVLCG